MAYYEDRFQGNLNEYMEEMEEGILQGSMSAHLEGTADFTLGDTRISVRVFERYSVIGSNRVSLNVTVAEKTGEMHVVAITSGGSQAMFIKINTFGEEAFLERFVEISERFRDRAGR